MQDTPGEPRAPKAAHLVEHLIGSTRYRRLRSRAGRFFHEMFDPTPTKTDMKLTVHIGTTKTGSTSIQAFLSQNRASLRAAGILVPLSLGVQNHFNIAISCLEYGQSDDLMKRVNILSNADLTTFRYKRKRAFLSEISAAKECHHTIITNEHLHSRCIKSSNIESFKEFVCPHFDKIEVLIYVRPQVDHLVSLYSTILRDGYTGTFESFVKLHMASKFGPYFNLQDIISRWSQVFGKENIIVRPYEATKNVLYGALGDFCNVIGLDIDADSFSLPDSTNSSISPNGQGLLKLVNSIENISPSIQEKIIEWIEANCSGRGTVPNIDLARQFMQRYTESNRWVVENYFPNNPEYLEPNWSVFDKNQK
ncbi:MAG: hypothetical protein ACEQSU_03405 [Microgenomates group bacterium]